MLENVKNRHLYFIGICGSGMSGLAHLFLDLGFHISGSDLQCSAVTETLVARGARFFLGQNAKHITKSLGAVVYSSAVDENNPEIQKAITLGIPIISRAELLSQLLRWKRSIGITGTHGKTTTTALVATILEKAPLSPSLLLGGSTKDGRQNGYLGKGDFLVYEACEAFASIDHFFSEISIVTNIDNDHMDYYKNMDNLLQAFLDYINRTAFYGVAILNEDDPYIRQILSKIHRSYILCGLTANNGVYANNIQYKGFHSYFDVYYKGKNLGNFSLQIPGEHNIYNALMAIATALHLEIPVPTIRDSLKSFEAPFRRFQYHGLYNGAYIIDDYAHHPTEIAETLKTAKQMKINDPSVERIIVIFQPHLYSRTKEHLKAFALALAQADFVILAPIYGSRETDLGDVSSSSLGEELERLQYSNFVTTKDLSEAKEYIVSIAHPNDIVLTMGAGNVNVIARELATTTTETTTTS